MIAKTDAQRIAAAVNILRPDWSAESIVTIIGRDHQHRPILDVTVALVWLALDAETATPGRLAESGPWWNAARAGYRTGNPPDRATRHARREDRCPMPGHEGYFATHCAGCKADAIAKREDQQ